jgi:hypothetical protein
MKNRFDEITRDVHLDEKHPSRSIFIIQTHFIQHAITHQLKSFLLLWKLARPRTVGLRSRCGPRGLDVQRCLQRVRERVAPDEFDASLFRHLWGASSFGQEYAFESHGRRFGNATLGLHHRS